jgi:hypothetical protein
MTKWICNCCNPSCTLEVMGYSVKDAPPEGCNFAKTFSIFDIPTPEWKVEQKKKAPAKKTRRPAKKPAKKVEQNPAAKVRSLLF